MNIKIIDWHYADVSEEEKKKFAKKKINFKEYQLKGRRATVPGSIFLDLLRQQEIPHPFLSENEKEVQWVEEEDWVFFSALNLPEEWRRKIKPAPQQWRIDLVFEGIDTFASIFVNEKLLGKTDNAFIPWRFPLKSNFALKKDTLNILVYVQSAKKIADRLMAKYGTLNAAFYPGRVYTRRPQYLTGWDWCPRLSGAALWRPVRLELLHFTRIADLEIRTPEISLTPKPSAKIEITLELETFCTTPAVKVELKICAGQNTEVAKQERFIKKLQPGRQKIKFMVELPAAQLWFPREFGEQSLYTAFVSLKQNNEILAERAVRFGIRKLQLLRDKDAEGESFIFSINGEKVFCRGYNWIPADIFPGSLTSERYRLLLRKVAESNANCLRVWGGGFYESDEFYNLCDELGILVWQDFMFACAEYPEHHRFIEQITHEAELTIRRLRHHPSIILWCGNNENEWLFFMQHKNWKKLGGQKIYSRILPALCHRLDPERPYWQSSPFGGTDPNSQHSGDRHNWSVWSEWSPIEKYMEDTGRFLSEFGFQSIPDRETVKYFAGNNYKSLTLGDEVFLVHQKQDFLGNVRLLRYLLDYLTIPSDFDELIYATQVMQAEALKLAVEHWRCLKFHTSGTLIWQFDDCWPVISWSVMDYFGRPKATWYYARRFFSPVLLSLQKNDEKINCAVVNDPLCRIRAEIVVQVRQMSGQIQSQLRFPVSLSPNAMAETISIPIKELNLTSPQDQFIFAFLQDINTAEIRSHNFYFLTRLRRLKWLKPIISIKHIDLIARDKAEITLSTDVFAKSVYIFTDTPAIVETSDNFFDLLPEEEKKITISFSSDVSEKLIRENFRLFCLNSLFIRKF